MGDQNGQEFREYVKQFINSRLLENEASTIRARRETLVLSLQPSTLSKDFQLMYEQKLFCDYTLRTGSSSFPVHRNVLAVRSPVFRAMLTSDMKEGRGDCADVQDIDDSSLNRLLLYLYTDKVDETLKWEDISQLYAAADKFEVLTLKDKCRDLLKKNLSDTNACKIFALASLHEDQNLKTRTINIMLAHDKDIIGKEQWNAFEKENPTVAVEALCIMYMRRMNSTHN